jgi:outer membrane protein OmpA-like peptidoglycan-associated protein
VDDATDRCPTSAEDRDGYQDDDGCPDLDNDLDGIADAQDRCPLESGLAANSGCLPAAPMPPAAAVQVTERAIELHESIFFARNSDRIEQRSTPLLDEIANVLKAHSEILQVVIEGHTDDRGRPAVNRKVSQRRATAVLLALEARGIDPRRLGTEGFGSDRPIVPNDTDEQRAQNRRVELRIEARAP